MATFVLTVVNIWTSLVFDNHFRVKYRKGISLSAYRLTFTSYAGCTIRVHAEATTWEAGQTGTNYQGLGTHYVAYAFGFLASISCN